jgi:hypothetical protein
LTKHIHIKAGENNEKMLTEAFPSFLWVARDFALQLINEKGLEITPSE